MLIFGRAFYTIYMQKRSLLKLHKKSLYFCVMRKIFKKGLDKSKPLCYHLVKLNGAKQTTQNKQDS